MGSKRRTRGGASACADCHAGDGPIMLQRIAYVVNVFPKLSETFIAWELAELRRRGVEVRILSLRPPDEELRHEIVAGAGLAKRTVYAPPEFLPVLQEVRPELMHAHCRPDPTARD